MSATNSSTLMLSHLRRWVPTCLQIVEWRERTCCGDPEPGELISGCTKTSNSKSELLLHWGLTLTTSSITPYECRTRILGMAVSPTLVDSTSRSTLAP